MKNIVLSIIVLVVVVGGAFYLFKDTKGAKGLESLGYGGNDYLATTTTPITPTPATTPAQTTTADAGALEKPDATNNKKSHMITIETNYGKIVFETYNSDAPKTVDNFVT